MRFYVFFFVFESLNQKTFFFLGLHLLPNSLAMSTGSVFAGSIMHLTGRYKTLNLLFGIFPFIGAFLIYKMREDSGPVQSWLSIVRRVFFPLSFPIINYKVFIDPSWFWKCCCVTNYAQYGYNQFYNI